MGKLPPNARARGLDPSCVAHLLAEIIVPCEPVSENAIERPEDASRQLRVKHVRARIEGMAEQYYKINPYIGPLADPDSPQRKRRRTPIHYIKG